jgi:serine/threonine protein kinase
MSSSKVVYKYGVTGFVELHKNTATKYSEFDLLYWLKELVALLYIWTYRTDNIIKYHTGCIKHKECPIDKHTKKYYECVFYRYPRTLSDIKLYRDSEVIQFLLDISSALSFLHQHDIMHRDLKPSNIAIDKSGRSILIDFSHSYIKYKPIDKLTIHVVTYYYRAPEVFRYQRGDNKVYNNKIDIYALGMILLEILTGRTFAEHYLSNVKEAHELVNNGLFDEIYNDVNEQIYYELNMSPIKMANLINTYFSENKRPFQHLRKYWKWIRKMLDTDVNKRYSAAELYDTVKQFAIKNQVAFIEPINGVLEKQIPKLSMITIKNETLYDKCIAYAIDVKDRNSMEFNIDDIKDIINMLITNNDVTLFNYHDFVGALVIIIETVIYDVMTSIDSYAELDNHNVKDAMVLILQKYNLHLFSNSRLFTYENL